MQQLLDATPQDIRVAQAELRVIEAKLLQARREAAEKLEHESKKQHMLKR